MKPTLGIDLGTTNCAVARAEEAAVEVRAIPQLVNPGEVRAEPLYPSSLYLPGPSEFAPGALALPWDDAPAYLTGELAKKRGADSHDGGSRRNGRAEIAAHANRKFG